MGKSSKSASSSGIVSSPSLSHEEAEFRAQDDLRTLSRAEEIRIDGKRMKHVKRHLTKQQKLLSRSLSRPA